MAEASMRHKSKGNTMWTKRATQVHIIKNSGFKVWLANELVEIAGALNPAKPWTRRYEREVKDFRKALNFIHSCPNPDSVEDCHNQMVDEAKRVLQVWP